MFQSITDSAFFKLLTTENWDSFLAVYAPVADPTRFSLCEINRVELLSDAIEVDGYDEAFGLTAQCRLDGRITEGVNAWPSRNIINELKASSNESLLIAPRMLELFSTPEGVDECRRSGFQLSNVSSIRIASTNCGRSEVMTIAADQAIPCTLRIAFGGPNSEELIREFERVGTVDTQGFIRLEKI